MCVCSIIQSDPTPSSLSMGFSRKEYWSGLPRPPAGDLPDPEINHASLEPPALAGRFFTTSTTWEACGELRQSKVHEHVTYMQYTFSCHSSPNPHLCSPGSFPMTDGLRRRLTRPDNRCYAGRRLL